MKKLISCEFNMDTACVELRYTEPSVAFSIYPDTLPEVF